MLDNLLRITEAGVKITKNEADRLHSDIIKWLIFTLILILIMWFFNAMGLMGINFFFLIIGSVYIFAKAIKPVTIFTAAIAGAGVNELQDKDKTQGAVAGMIFLSRIFIGIMLGFFIIGGLLATWSFKEAPMMFFPIAVMSILIGLTIEYYQIKGKVLPTIILIYAIIVILKSFWFTVPEKITSDLNKYIPVISTNEKADMDFPEIKLTKIGERNGVVIPMNFTTEAKVHILAPLTKEGIAHELCRKVIEPIKVLDLVDTPKKQVESDDPEKIGMTHFMHLTREMKKHLFKYGVKEVRVNFYLVETWAEDPSKCN